jgi:TPR repeat protein
MGLFFKHTVGLSVWAVFLLTCSGCMAPVAFQAAGAVGSTSPVAINLAEKGKAESYWVARYSDVVAATERAAQVLSLELLEKKSEAERTTLRYGYSKGQNVEIMVEHQTATMTSAQINYGLSGAAAFANLLAREIAVELHKAGDFLEDPLVEQK